ncbi:unnamed protein product [Nezara viridula]|uniref:Uncharacterized protein n=2 Tax=Nezara viridula TaxID=85310 RepID=A0A9P0EAQ0_NEZVI|nr:unnamed protein product [Nezara viridula]CAH1394707.1 unnamed protein product [Nezara viridula]
MVHHKIMILCIQREILTGSRDPSQHEEFYRGILASTPMRPIDNKMVCQLIPKFFKHFPHLAKRALEVYFDLCEDDDVAVRQEAIKGLPQLCGEIQEYTVLIARLLAKLLLKTDSGEVSIVSESLVSVIQWDPVSAIAVILDQIKKGSYKVLGSAKTFFNPVVNSNEYLIFFCKKILPKFMSFPGAKYGSESAIAILKLLTEVATYSDLKFIDDLIDEVFDVLTQFLPIPAKDEQDTYKRLQFPSVECLLYTMHHMMRSTPSYFLYKPDQLTDFRIRLLYLLRASHTYTKILEDVLKKKEKDEEDRAKIVTLKIISNIKILIKDFFRNPPSQKSLIVLSWLGIENPSAKRKATSADRTSKIFKGHYGQRVHRPRMFVPKVPKYLCNMYPPNIRLSRFDKWALDYVIKTE